MPFVPGTNGMVHGDFPCHRPGSYVERLHSVAAAAGHRRAVPLEAKQFANLGFDFASPLGAGSNVDQADIPFLIQQGNIEWTNNDCLAVSSGC